MEVAELDGVPRMVWHQSSSPRKLNEFYFLVGQHPLSSQLEPDSSAWFVLRSASWSIPTDTVFEELFVPHLHFLYHVGSHLRCYDALWSEGRPLRPSVARSPQRPQGLDRWHLADPIYFLFADHFFYLSFLSYIFFCSLSRWRKKNNTRGPWSSHLCSPALVIFFPRSKIQKRNDSFWKLFRRGLIKGWSELRWCAWRSWWEIPFEPDGQMMKKKTEEYVKSLLRLFVPRTFLSILWSNTIMRAARKRVQSSFSRLSFYFFFYFHFIFTVSVMIMTVRH